MPLVPKSKITRKEDGTELYIEFVNATGVYNVDTNPGGFNTPNPARNTLAAVFYGNHKLSTGDVLCTPNVFDPLTVTSFTIPLTRAVNGHLNYNIFLLPIFDDQLTYEEDDVVYDNTDLLNPIIKQFINAEWVTITEVDLVDSEVLQKAGNIFAIPDAESFRNELNALRIKTLKPLIDESCGCEDYNKVRMNFDFVDGTLEEATNDFCAGAFAEAQLKLEAVLAFELELDEQ